MDEEPPMGIPGGIPGMMPLYIKAPTPVYTSPTGIITFVTCDWCEGEGFCYFETDHGAVHSLGTRECKKCKGEGHLGAPDDWEDQWLRHKLKSINI